MLSGCSFSFDDSGIYVLMGQNGSGKSTFLRICSLIEAPDRGEVNYFSGTEMLKNNIGLKRRITLVLPNVGVFNSSVFKNIAYGLRIRGIEKQKIKEMVEVALEFVGLSHKRNHDALTLSSGETQRLGIARAMVIDPEILFLDEPTASVDEKNTQLIEEIILNMKGKTVVIATHDMAQAERLSDRILIIHSGRIS